MSLSEAPTDILLAPSDLAGLPLRNRLAVAPMTRISATADGRATEEMVQYYAAFAEGGFGLLITEGNYTDRSFSQGYFGQPGLADEEQAAHWMPVVAAAGRGGAKIIAQLMHAGALSQGNPHRPHTIGPSAVQPRGKQLCFYRGEGPYQLPQAMSREQIEEAKQGFVAAALRARDVGFDGVEIHGANGYLLDQFLTDYANLRTDEYGGSAAGRVRLAAEVISSVREAVGSQLVVGVRVSQAKVNDFEHRWAGGASEAQTIFAALAAAGADYIHTTQFEAWRPADEDSPLSLAELARKHSGLPVVANGSLHDPARATAMVESGAADIVSIGRAALADPEWPLKVASNIAPVEFDPGFINPLATLENGKAYARKLALRNCRVPA
jgi:2,4-dienoyl-CoA reductase-like NADH-dependent reductase (Old Yellow Enzyme family)